MVDSGSECVAESKIGHMIESESDCVVEHESVSCMKGEDIELKKNRSKMSLPTLGDLKLAGAGFPETSVRAIASPRGFFARHWYFPCRSTLPTLRVFF